MLLYIAIASAILCLSSCNKQNGVGGSVGVQVGPALITLTWGNAGASGYYYPNGFPNGVTEFIGYIDSKPTDINSIPIVNALGLPLCTAQLSSAQWQQANNFLVAAQSVTYPPRRPVKIKWVRNTFTNGGDDFYIIAY